MGSISRLRSSRAVVVLAAAGFLAACGERTSSDDAPDGTDGTPPAVAVRDSAGIEIVESTAPIWAGGTPWSVGAEPEVSIGVVDGPAEYQLSAVSSAVRLPDGRILVAEGGSGELRYYGADGEHLRSVGREGEGPGEFSSVAGLALVGDIFFVYDRDLARFSLLDLDVERVRIYGLERSTVE